MLVIAPCQGQRQVHVSSMLLAVALMSFCITYEHSCGGQHAGTANCTLLPAEVLLGVQDGFSSIVAQLTP